MHGLPRTDADPTKGRDLVRRATRDPQSHRREYSVGVMRASRRPLLATEGGKPFTHAEWDLRGEVRRLSVAWRALAAARPKCARRAASTAPKWFPEIAQLLASLPGGPHVVDERQGWQEGRTWRT